MSESIEREKFEQVVRRIDPTCKLLRSWPLIGGVSAQVIGLEIKRADGHIQKMILRRHGAIDLQHNPHIAADEFALLQILRSSALPTPVPFHLDTSRTIFPTPYLVIEFVDGASDFAPANVSDFIRQMAAVLARIHWIQGQSLAISFLPRLVDRVAEKLKNSPAVLDDALDEGRIRAALAAASPLLQANQWTLLHGDFWPGNILWKDGQLRAVIDWEDALIGDPLADLAYARLEILFAFGDEAMLDFTRAYQQSQIAIPSLDVANLPFWDLWAALRPAGKLETWGLDPAVEARMRERHKAFVNRALEKLSP
jgi:aminoglycoside phosphotransferase (APT) family kinase protein